MYTGERVPPYHRAYPRIIGVPSRRIWAVSAFVLQPAGEWIVGWVGKAEGWNDGGTAGR
jgi:hypothetical protein